MLGNEALQHFIVKCKEKKYKNILEIGPGKTGEQTKELRRHDLNTSTVDIVDGATYHGDYLELPPFTKQFDGIWASHVLEHTPNPGLFLHRIYNDTKMGGIVAITVPPSKPQIVSGHLTIWNAGLLLYNMVAAGFDCSRASVATYNYNVSVVVEKYPTNYTGPVNLQTNLLDIVRLFPKELNITNKGFDGNIKNIKW